MSDPMGQGMPPQNAPMARPPMGGQSPVDKNLSVGRPLDAMIMGQQMDPNMTVRDYFAKLGVNVDGPMTQLVDLAKKQAENMNPINKMRNIAADTALQKGGQPPTMPGVKPMVAPPGQPAPAGMQGLLSKIGG